MLPTGAIIFRPFEGIIIVFEMQRVTADNILDISSNDRISRCCLSCADGGPCREANGNPCPEYTKDISGGICRASLTQYCVLDEEGGSIFAGDRWPENGEGCWKALRCNMFERCVPKPSAQKICGAYVGENNLQYSLEGYEWSRRIVKGVFARYSREGYVWGASPDNVTYSPFQKRMYDNVCCPFSGICQGALSTVCEEYSVNDLLSRPNLSPWCGCHLRAEEYGTDIFSASLTVPCNPVCDTSYAIPLINSSGERVLCEQDVCMINDNTITLLGSQIDDINFTQICTGCDGGRCQCIIQNNDVVAVGADLSNSDINIYNICGSFSCQIPNPVSDTPQFIPVPCDFAKDSGTQKQLEEGLRRRKFWKILGISVSLFIAFLIIVLMLVIVATFGW